MIDIEDPELETTVRRLVMKIIQELLSSQPPESQMALMLHAHIRDFGEFRYEIREKFAQVDGRLDHIDSRLDRIDSRLDHIENTMATKDDLERFATKDDLNTQTIKIIDAVRKLLDKP